MGFRFHRLTDGLDFAGRTLDVRLDLRGGLLDEMKEKEDPEE